MGKRKRDETFSIHLPVELWDVIVRLACQVPSQSDLADIDFKTALSLTLVSKQIYRVTTPLLYTHVRLTKPSDLLLYARTAATRPSLASQTKTLWIGPDHMHVEGRDTWPLDAEGNAMKSSITDPLRMPVGLQIGTYFPFTDSISMADSESSTDEDWSMYEDSGTDEESVTHERCSTDEEVDTDQESSTDEEPSTEQSIFAEAKHIIREAGGLVGQSKDRSGVQVQSEGDSPLDGRFRDLDTAPGRLKVYRAQQALDIFLAEVRTNQDLSSGNTAETARCLPTPGLSTSSTAPSISSQRVLTECTTTAPLRMHAAFDRFDHPIIYDSISASSSDSQEDIWDRMRLEIAYDDTDYAIEIHDDSDELGALQQSHRKQHQRLKINCLFISTSFCGRKSFDLQDILCREAGSANQPSLGALIMMAGIVLARCPNLECLALTSYLRKAVSGERSGPSLERLRLLTLGPVGRRHQTPLRLSHPGLRSVKMLRLWDSSPNPELARSIDGANALPALEDMECTWSGPEASPEAQSPDELGWSEAQEELDTVSAIARLLGCAKQREGPPRPNSFGLKIDLNQSRARHYCPRATEELLKHPLLELKLFPYEAECDHCPRLRALAQIRHQWEKETAELLGGPREQAGQTRLHSRDIRVDCPCSRRPRSLRWNWGPYWSEEETERWEEEREWWEEERELEEDDEDFEW